MKRITFAFCGLMLLSTAASAQRYKHQQKLKPAPVKVIENMSVDGRVGYEYQIWDGMTMNDNTGFKGQYLSFSLSGSIADNLSYEYRQRLDNVGKKDFFDATEILNVKWNITDAVHMTFGKQLFALGGFDYNTLPIDRYYTNEFMNQFEQYQLGLAIDFNLGSRDNIMLQGTNTPLNYTNGNHMYAGSMLWTGRHGFYTALWSANVLQYKLKQNADKHWMAYVALGNKFNFTDKIYLYVDAMSRMRATERKVLEDYTLTGELSAEIIDGLRIYGRYTRDTNTDNKQDAAVIYNTELNTAGGGIEYKPLKNNRNDFTVFANGIYTWGENTSSTAKMFEDEIRFEAGVKIHMDIIGAMKSIKK